MRFCYFCDFVSFHFFFSVFGLATPKNARELTRDNETKTETSSKRMKSVRSEKKEWIEREKRPSFD